MNMPAYFSRKNLVSGVKKSSPSGAAWPVGQCWSPILWPLARHHQPKLQDHGSSVSHGVPVYLPGPGCAGAKLNHLGTEAMCVYTLYNLPKVALSLEMNWLSPNHKSNAGPQWQKTAKTSSLKCLWHSFPVRTTQMTNSIILWKNLVSGTLDVPEDLLTREIL